MFQYVGCNPEKIRAAQAAMRRAIEYDELVAQIAHLEDFAEQCCRNLTDVLCTLRAFEAVNSSSNRLRRLNAKSVTWSPIAAGDQFSSEKTT